MDTVKDTKMQPVKDAVINTLRKVSVDCYWPTSPVTIKELLDRIEAAEKERDVLRDRLALESQENGALRDSVDRACEERDALRAKITEMEKQKPVAWTTKLALEYGASRLGFQVSGVNMWGENGVPLYTLPGAQPAPSVPNYIELMNAAQQIVEGKPIYRRFVKGTPLENDIAVWMADFATEHAAPKPEAKP